MRTRIGSFLQKLDLAFALVLERLPGYFGEF